MKLGIIRCLQTEDVCPMSADFKTVKEKKGAFEGVSEDIEIIGVNTCGGCPGKKAAFRAMQMVKRGADAVALASCIHKGTPIGFPCPFAAQITAAIKAQAGGNVRIFEYTHD